ncbi:hypothetical protein SPONL_892 [uncultured Candidatus Thioglobus sp.]|nr:hypothetical protein SPONL_892 [uncultured Candidatus Thioglobus sp.]
MNYALRVPDYYKDEIKALKGEVSINQFIVNAVAEKISALKTSDYLTKRAASGSISHIQKLLNQVPDIEPEECDRL